MSETRRPKAVADQLGISPATLRLWSNKFQVMLSPSAQGATTEKGTATQRRYTDEDVRYFHRAKQLLGSGSTYEQVLETLQEEGPPDEDVVTEAPQPQEQTSTLAVESQMQIALISLREALATKDTVIESQQQTISAIERHVTDLQEENQRLRQQLETSPEAVESPQTRVLWWERLIARLGGERGR